MSTPLVHSEIAVALPAAGEVRYETQPTWMGMNSRYFESAETTRLNQAHWTWAEDESVNYWLAEHLSKIRARSAYEARQNGTVLGVINTHADDIVGPDGPTLQVLSDDDAYNTALEQAWREWFSAPTPKPNVSGAAWLKLRVKSFWKCGEFLDQIVTDPNAEGPVAMRVRPIPPRRLRTPFGMTGDPNVFMGIRFDALGRPARYYLHDPAPMGSPRLDPNGFTTVPPDLIIHEFISEEEEQARGIPWLNTALQPSADLRDYDDQVQDAARQMADQSALLYTEHPDAPVWQTPEQTTVERRTVKMVPPGWKPWEYKGSMPPVQYPEFRSERQREIGRPQGMPLLMIRLDSSKHNYSSARLDTQTYGRACSGLQCFISGTPNSAGTLNRLADMVAAEGRFKIQALRRRPAVVIYQWTWPVRPHVDPSKEALAEATSLESGTLCLSDALASRGTNLETHVAKKQREIEAYKKAGLPLPLWMTDTTPTAGNAKSSLSKSVEADEAAEKPGNKEEVPANG